MKAIVWILMIWASWTQAQTQFSDLPTVNYHRNPYYESRGFRLGFILDFHRDGLLIWSYEGQMMMGYGTARADIVNPDCLRAKEPVINAIRDNQKRQSEMEAARKECYMFTNPWSFSTMDSRIYGRYSAMENATLTPVLLYYVRPWFSVEHVITNTKNFVEGIYAVNSELQIPESYSIPTSAMPFSLTINHEKGFVEGRFVKASLDHVIRKSFEVTLQEGPSGNNFRLMSVAGQDMFDYIIKVMLTGKSVRVGYVELLGVENALLKIGKDYDTSYRIISVELKPDTAPMGLPVTPK